MKRADIKAGYYVVGKMRRTMKPSVTLLAQFRTVKAASAFIDKQAKRSKHHAALVEAGKYVIDGPCKKEGK